MDASVIFRVWRGQVDQRDAHEYEEYQKMVGPPGYKEVDGNRGVLMGVRSINDRYEIGMFTLWESLQSIEVFAGRPIDRARYYERDFEYLIDPPELVEHFEVCSLHPFHVSDDQRIDLRCVQFEIREVAEVDSRNQCLRNLHDFVVAHGLREFGFLVGWRTVHQNLEIVLASLELEASNLRNGGSEIDWQRAGVWPGSLGLGPQVSESIYAVVDSANTSLLQEEICFSL